MLDAILEDTSFAKMMQQHIEGMVGYFFSKEQNFGILCRIEEVSFDPSLPKEISSEFRPLTLFFLAGYTFETAYIQDDMLIFEAGFGVDNYGSVVSVPLLSIMQIIVEETPIFINLAVAKKKKEAKKSMSHDGVENSMKSFLSNPENSKFLKK